MNFIILVSGSSVLNDTKLLTTFLFEAVNFTG